MSTENNAMLFPLFERVSESLTELEKGYSELSLALQKDQQLRLDYLAILPYRKSDQEASGVHRPESVSAEERTPEFVASLLSAIRYREDQDPKSTVRAPGLIGVSRQTLDLIHAVNQLKSTFKSNVKAIPTRKRRMINRSLPGLSRLQAYREIVTLTAQPQHVSFFWAAHKTGGSRISVADLRQDLKAERESVPQTDKSLLSAIDYDLELIQHLPDNEWLSKRRSISVHPQCNIKCVGRPLQQEDAYLPIFYERSASSNAPDVIPLDYYDPADDTGKRGIRSDRKVENEPLLERLHIYRYQPQFRKFK